MVRVTRKTVDGKHLYINILDFKDEDERDAIYFKLRDMLEHET